MSNRMWRFIGNDVAGYIEGKVRAEELTISTTEWYATRNNGYFWPQDDNGECDLRGWSQLPAEERRDRLQQ